MSALASLVDALKSVEEAGDDGKLTIPADPSIPITGELTPIQNVGEYVLELQKRMKQQKEKREKRSLRSGEGQNIALSRGMFVGPMNQITGFRAVYGFQ